MSNLLTVKHLSTIKEFSELSIAKTTEGAQIFASGVAVVGLADIFNTYSEAMLSGDDDLAWKMAFELRDLEISAFAPGLGELQYFLSTSMIKAIVDDKLRRKVATTSEADYKQALIDGFGDIYFPEYELVGSEVRPTPDEPDRIDILAKCNATKRDVIIELKLGSKSGHKQLASYARYFEDPILINISEDIPKVIRIGIKYMTYSDIGLVLNSEVAP